MKKVFLIACVGLFSVTIAMVLSQPNDFTVKRSKVIADSQEEVFGHVVDLKKWQKWSPWFERDPQMSLEYSDLTAGPNSFVKWDSKSEGTGKQTITDVVGNEAIKIKLEFYKPFTGKAYSYFNFRPSGENNTEVLWMMEAKNKGFVDKFFYLVFGTKKMIENDFEKGLENLNKTLSSKDI